MDEQDSPTLPRACEGGGLSHASYGPFANVPHTVPSGMAPLPFAPTAQRKGATARGCMAPERGVLTKDQ